MKNHSTTFCLTRWLILISSFFLLTSSFAFAQGNTNATIKNTSANPVPVTIVGGGGGIAGTVAIDQTTPGTTNAVKTTNFPTTVDSNSGNKSSSTLRVVMATDQPTMTNAQPVQQAASTSTTATTFTQGVKAVTTAGTPVRLVASQTLVESVEIHARKNTTTANTGNIYLGFSATGGSNYRVLAPGESFSISAPPGKKLDLNLIFLDAATSADAVVYSALD